MEILSYNTHKRDYVDITQVYNDRLKYRQNMKYSFSGLLVDHKNAEIIVSIQGIGT